jgi:hypothetical protein
MLIRPFILLLLATNASAHDDLPVEGKASLRQRRNIKSKKGGATGGSNGGGNLGVGTESVRGTTYRDGSTLSAAGVRENFPCDALTDAEIDEKVLLSDPEGTGGVCTNGCLRNYSFLVCDESNDFPHVACVCSANTFNSGETQVEIGGPGEGSGQGAGQGSGAPAPEDDGDKNDGNGTENGNGNVPSIDPNQCIPQFQGNGWGMEPTDLSKVPIGFDAGDCTSSNHCGGDDQPNVCCK